MWGEEEEEEGGRRRGGGPQLTDRAPLLSPLSVLLAVVPGRRRAGCRGSLRRLWSSWYASLSAPLSTPWPRATASARRRSTKRSDSDHTVAAAAAAAQHQKLHQLPTGFSSLLVMVATC